MSYCLGIKIHDGLVMASDSRTSSGADQVNTCQKMYCFSKPGERVFVILTTGSLSLSQSITTLLRNDFDNGQGLARVKSMYEAARVVGDMVRHVSDLDRPYLEKDDFRFNVNLLLGGQMAGAEHDLYMIYPQGNPLRSTVDSPFLQIGETKYGRPILDRGIRYDQTSLETAAKYALISFDSTLRSNATVGPPIDLLVYHRDEFRVSQRRRFQGTDAELIAIHSSWERALQKAVLELPPIDLSKSDEPGPGLSGSSALRSGI